MSVSRVCNCSLDVVPDNVANVNVAGSSPVARFRNDPVSHDAGSCLLTDKLNDSEAFTQQDVGSRSMFVIVVLLDHV